jgi:hypothetical protein
MSIIDSKPALAKELSIIDSKPALAKELVYYWQ